MNVTIINGSDRRYVIPVNIIMDGPALRDNVRPPNLE